MPDAGKPVKFPSNLPLETAVSGSQSVEADVEMDKSGDSKESTVLRRPLFMHIDGFL